MKKASLALLAAVLLAACHQTVIETNPPAPSAKAVALQVAEQKCQEKARFKGLQILGPFFASDTDEKYRACMKKQGFPVVDQ